MLNKLKNETDIKAFMRQVLLLVWTLGYVTKKKERQMASLVRRCRIQLTTEAEGTVRVPVQTSTGKTLWWAECPINRLYIPSPYLSHFFIRHPCSTMVLQADKDGVAPLNVLRETVRLLSLDCFYAKRGWGLRKLGYAKIHYYRRNQVFVQTRIEDADINDAMLELTTAYLAKHLGCFECFKEPAAYKRSKRQLLHAAEQSAVPKITLVRGVFRMADPEVILKKIKKGQ